MPPVNLRSSAGITTVGIVKSNGASDFARPVPIIPDQSAAAECCVEPRCFSIAFSSFGGDIGVSVILTPTAR